MTKDTTFYVSVDLLDSLIRYFEDKSFEQNITQDESKRIYLAKNYLNKAFCLIQPITMD